MTTGRRLIIVPLLLLLLLPALPAAGQGENRSIILGESELREIFTAIINKESLWPEEELSISGFSAFPDQVQIPAGILDYKLDNDFDPGHLGRQSLQVILLVNGREQARVRLNGNLRRMGEVVVTTRRIDRGEIIGQGDLTLHRREIDTLANTVITDPQSAHGLQARTTLQAGTVIQQNQLEKPPLVRRGDRVTIRAGNGRVRVTAPGEAREIGAEGDLIRVRNLMSRQEITARVASSGLVVADERF